MTSLTGLSGVMPGDAIAHAKDGGARCAQRPDPFHDDDDEDDERPIGDPDDDDEDEDDDEEEDEETPWQVHAQVVEIAAVRRR